MATPTQTRTPLGNITESYSTVQSGALDDAARKRQERNRQQRKWRAEMTVEQREEMNRKQREYRVRKKAESIQTRTASLPPPTVPAPTAAVLVSCRRNTNFLPSRLIPGFMYRDHVPPESFDWEKKGAITFAQQQLGEDCWAHAAVGTVGGLYAIRTGGLIKLSAQQILDYKPFSRYRYSGGFPQYAFDYICENGLVSEDVYPYVGKPGKCRKFDYASATIDGYQFVPTNSEFALRQAVANQPVCVNICMDDHFDDYRGGIVDDMGSHGELNHSTLLVGYGAISNGQKFWKAKDSLKGRTILIARDVGNKGGAFGIAKVHVSR